MTPTSVQQPLDPPPLPRRSRPLRDQSGEPHWAIVTKWCLLGVAVTLAVLTSVELVRTVLTLAEVPVNIVTTAPALHPPPATSVPGAGSAFGESPLGPVNESSDVADPVGKDTVGNSVPSGGGIPQPAGRTLPGASGVDPGAAAETNLAVAELTQIRKLLERTTSPQRPASRRPAGAETATTSAPSQTLHSSGPKLLSGIERAPSKARATGRRQISARRREPLRVSSGPRVTLIGADALVETELENRSEELQKRTVVLELRVNGRRRQQRKLRVRLAPGSKIHLSERFSTTLPDGTYSAAVLLDPLG